MRRPRGAAALGLIAWSLVACGPSSGTALRGPIQDYDEGRYALAHDEATDVMRRTEGSTHHDAAYLSGLSAYRLGELDESERRLLTAAESSDATTVANAKATLGLVRLEQNRPAEAAALFQEAADGLAGPDHEQASAYAVAARHRAAGAAYAPPPPRGPGPSATPAPAGDRPPYALQVGAFASRDRAERAAAEARPAATRAGLGPARIDRRRIGGQTLWAVQFGRFRSRAEAADVRSRLGRIECIVVSAAP